MSIVLEITFIFCVSLFVSLFVSAVYIHVFWRHITCLRCSYRFLAIRNHNVFPKTNPMHPVENTERWHTICPRCKEEYMLEWRGLHSDIPKLWYRTDVFVDAPFNNI